MPEAESFGEGLIQIIQNIIPLIRPDLHEASKVCIGLVGAVLLTSLIQGTSNQFKITTDIVAAAGISSAMLLNVKSLIHLAGSTITDMTEYGKLLLPVLTTALAAQGGISGSGALYAATAMFDALLCGLISGILVPMIYLHLALCIGYAAIGEDLLKRLRDFFKWLISWSLKTTMYIFTGYITITGVVCGTTDQAALKAAKLTISGAVPVVGGILSDASEAVLVSAGVVKNAVGVYGLIAVTAIAAGPFLRIGIQYLLLKLTAAVCAVFGSKNSSELVNDFSTAMGFGLAMTGAVCLILLISVVCFMKGVMV
jgi:stage III sporulation protein AE